MLKVRELREAKGWRQLDLAYRAELAPSVVSEIENGKREPRAGTLRKLAAALEVEVPDLYPKEQPPLFPGESPEIPERELRAFRRWMGVLEQRMRARELTHAELEHELDAALAFGLDRAVRLPAEDYLRFHSLVRAMLVEAKEFTGLRAELRELEARLETEK